MHTKDIEIQIYRSDLHGLICLPLMHNAGILPVLTALARMNYLNTAVVVNAKSFKRQGNAVRQAKIKAFFLAV